MRKMFGSIVVLLLLVVLSSCKNFLDESIRGQQNFDTFYQTEEEVSKAVSGCYHYIYSNDWEPVSIFYLMGEYASDDCWAGNLRQQEEDYMSFSQLRYTPANGKIKGFWDHTYKGIYNCNLTLENLPTSPVAISNPELIERSIAEVKFIRAYHYFQLVKNWGGVPLHTRILGTDDLNTITKARPEEVYAQIKKDLKEAAEVLPQKSEYDANDEGRVPKGAAWGYLSKVYLFQEKWDSCKIYADLVLNSGEYDLENSFGNVWYIDNKNGQESIFEIQTSSDLAYQLGNMVPVQQGGRAYAWGWNTPTSDLENVFKNEGDDIRLRSTIIRGEINNDGIGEGPVYDIDGTSVMISNLKIASLSDSKSMRISRKSFIHPDRRPLDFQGCKCVDKNLILMRLAEVILNKAEACYHLQQEGDARIEVNKIRDRVDLDDITETGESLLRAIWKERRMELALEFKRFDDIRRQIDPQTSKPRIASIMGSNGTFVKYNTESNNDEWEIQNPEAALEPNNKGEAYQDFRLLLPIPLYDIESPDSNIEQNPGY